MREIVKRVSSPQFLHIWGLPRTSDIKPHSCSVVHRLAFAPAHLFGSRRPPVDYEYSKTPDALQRRGRLHKFYILGVIFRNSIGQLVIKIDSTIIHPPRARDGIANRVNADGRPAKCVAKDATYDA